MSWRVLSARRAKRKLRRSDLEEVVRAEPDWLPPHIELASLYYRLKRPEDGERERKIVDRLTEEQRQLQTKSHIISPQPPSH